MTRLDLLTPKQKANLKKRYDMHCKYEEAVRLYAETDMTMDAIARKCNFTVSALGAYLRRNCRELVLKRHNLAVKEGEDPQGVKIFKEGKQNVNAHIKYKDAVEACGALQYIDLNLSQIARMSGVKVAALSNFVRTHYPDLLEWREKVRRRLGINDNLQRGARPVCTGQYAEAVELYRTTELPIPEVAEQCNVSVGGFGQHLRFYHKDILKARKEKRKQAQAAPKKKIGQLLGNGQRYQPAAGTEEKYAEAVRLYATTPDTLKSIARQLGLVYNSLSGYIRRNYPELAERHRNKD